MPFSSSEIAASIGAFQGQSMNNMAYSQMIGQGTFNQGGMSDRMAGGLMSRAAGVAGPLAAGGLGLMGLDPMSLGLKAGQMAWGAGAGAMGAGAAGLGAMGVASGGLAIAGYAGNQMMMGGQQQANLNNVLRGSFNFQNSSGGQGFDRSGMAQIGSMMRSSTHQFGPEGQIAGFGELTNLVQNMGKMGMASGVKDVQEFGRKFKEMLTTLKTVAHELGTSLEEAQHFVQAQKSSGIFRAGDQTKFTAQARGTSLSGGLALSEVTGMASIGSQISRSVGGLGRAGAFGGMRTIGQIGSAMQVGALSEEDIYNATGLTGAEGRQSMAANEMSKSAQFLSSGRGRRFLASVAGKNGQLDEGSVQNWMTGDMSTGETMSQAHKNLAGVGRANFIRNEGRLRGAALERFGGLINTMAYKQWLGTRGHDPNNMDDRSMLAFQRFSGLGRDEAEAQIKQIQALPEILKQQRQSAANDEYSQRLGAARKGAGIEGMKRKFEQVREKLQGTMQQAGADVFTSASDTVEQWWNKMTGIYEQKTSEGINDLMESARAGGKGQKALGLAMGMGTLVGNKGLGKGGIDAATQSILGGRTLGASGMAAFEKSRQGLNAAHMGALSEGTKETQSFISSNKDWFQNAYMTKLASIGGEQRVSEFGNMLKIKADGGDESSKALYEKWKAAGSEGKTALLASAEKQGKIPERASLEATWKHPEGINSGMFATGREGEVALGRHMLGERDFMTGGISGKEAATTFQGFFRSQLGAAGAVAGGLLGATGDIFGLGLLTGDAKKGGLMSSLATKFGSIGSGGDALAASMGNFMQSKEGSRLVSGMMTGDAASTEDAKRRIIELKASHDDSSKGELKALQETSLASEYGKIANAGFPEADVKALLKKGKEMLGKDITPEDLKKFYNSAGASMGVHAKESVRQVSERTSADMNKRRESMLGIGKIGEDGKLTLDSAASAKMGKAEKDVLEMGMASINAAADAAKLPDGDKRKAKMLMGVYDQESALQTRIAGMSTAEKKSFARQHAGTDLGAMAGESLGQERRLGSLMNSRGEGGGKRGAFGAIAAELNINLSKEEMDSFKGKSAQDQAKFLQDKGKFGNADFQKTIQTAIDDAAHGKLGKAAGGLSQGLAQDDDAKKKVQGRQQKDPMQDLVETTKAGNKYLEALVKGSTSAQAALDSINGNISKIQPPEGGSGGPAPGGKK